VLLGVEAVLEFQVLTNSYSSEFGRSAGGVINAVTRSGTNQLHGSLFEFLRNSDLDAKNFFDQASQPIPSFKRNQFGAVVGGPIHKDQTFFFGSFESLIDRLGVTGVTSVPNLAARQGTLPSGQIKVNQAILRFSTCFRSPTARTWVEASHSIYSPRRSQPMSISRRDELTIGFLRTTRCSGVTPLTRQCGPPADNQAPRHQHQGALA